MRAASLHRIFMLQEMPPVHTGKAARRRYPILWCITGLLAAFLIVMPFGSPALALTNSAAGTSNGIPLDGARSSVTLNLSNAPTVTAVAEIYPNSIAMSSTGNQFSYHVLPTISGNTGGFDRVDITAPAGYSNLSVSGLSVGGSSLIQSCPVPGINEYCAETQGQLITITLGGRLTSSLSAIELSFSADGPVFSNNSDFTSVVRDMSNGGTSVPATPGNADGDASDANSITVDVIPVLDPAKCTVTADPPVVRADGATFSTVTVRLLDPQGQPVLGKTVTLVSDRGGLDSISQPLAPTDAAGLATGTIRSIVPGVSTITATDTTDSIVLPAQAQVFFSQGAVLDIVKLARDSDAVVGDVVRYQVEVKNTSTSDVVQVQLDDRVPPNFKYLKGSTQVNGTPAGDPSGNRILTFDIGTVPALGDSNGNGLADPGEDGYLTVTYSLVVGSGADPGVYSNIAVITDFCDTCFVSNQSEALVTVSEDPLFDLGTIIGKVYEDKDRDGAQGEGEPGIAEAMVALDDGTYVLTDEHGRYHIPAVTEGHRLIKINRSSLRAGAEVTTEESLVLWITPGLMAEANFGVFFHEESESIGTGGSYLLEVTSQEDEMPLEIRGNTETSTLFVNGRPVNLATNDIRMGMENLQEIIETRDQQMDRPILFRVEVDDPGEVSRWTLKVTDATGKIFWSARDRGSPPETISWDGRNKDNVLVEGGEIYRYQMGVEYADGSRSASRMRLFGVNHTAAVSLTLTGGAFEFNSARLSREARAVLKKAAVILRKYPKEKVVIEGHADAVGSEKYNLALSKKRAESAASYLSGKEGIAAERLVVTYYGESRPVASNDTPEGQKLNRRVEVRGTMDEVKQVTLEETYRRNPVVMIDKINQKVDSSGRFQADVSAENRDSIEFEMSGSRGSSVHTDIPIPLLEILRPLGGFRVPYGLIEDGCRVNDPPRQEGWRNGDPAVTYRLDGVTDHGNRITLNGVPLVVDQDGIFRGNVELPIGTTDFTLAAENSRGVARIVNLRMNVSDRDEEGQLIVEVEPVPYLTVSLPPKGVTLTNPSLPLSGHTDPGNRVYVNNRTVPVETDGSFRHTLTLERGKSNIEIRAVDPRGRTGSIVREVEVKKTDLFLLALVDGKVGMLKGRGYLKGAGLDKKREYYTEGRIAYYLKGVVAGKYLITSAFDTGVNEFERMFEDLDEVENDRLLTNLDPEKFYPVYGDNSSIVYDAESQGKFYLALDSDELHLLVGNYPLKYTDTELAAFNRTLFGGQVLYRSVSRTKYGQPDTVIGVFGAEVRQAHVRDLLRATGGSLYYLSKGNVIEGSEQVTLELRDKDTGLILARITQRQNVDYSIKYDEGRIFFSRPISSVSEDGNVNIVDRGLLSGNPVFIQVDYEIEVDSFEKTASGGRIKKQVGAHVGIGATYVNDELESGQYELKGLDSELRFGKNTRIVAEYAESSGTDALTFVSDDGGLTYTDGTLSPLLSGKAWKVAADLDVGEWFGSSDRIQLGGYVKKIDPGFRSSGNFFEEGQQNIGGKARLNISEKDKILARYDREEFDNAASTKMARTDVGTLQWYHEEEQWAVTGEYQFRELKNGEGGTVESSSVAAARLQYSPSESFSAGLEHQETLSGPENNQTSLSAKYRVHSDISLQATGTVGTLGESLQGGAALELDKGRIYLEEQISEDRAGRSLTTILGGESSLGSSSKIYTEYQWERTDPADRYVSLMGAKWQKELRKGLKFLLSGEYTEVEGNPISTGQYAVATGLSYTHASGFRASTRDEVRKEHGNQKRIQFITSNEAEVKLNPDYSFLGYYRYSKTRDENTGETEARFEEFSVGLAYRPVKHDRFNALTRFTKVSDLRPQSPGASDAFETNIDVVSLEWSLDLNRYLEWVTKEAARLKREEIAVGSTVKTHTYLSIQRLNFHLWPRVDVGTEYRILLQKEADDQRQGWLTEVTWEAVSHLRLGVGYNFTDFSDNEFSENDYSVQGWFFRLQGKY